MGRKSVSGSDTSGRFYEHGARSVDQLTWAGKNKCGMLECYKNRAPRVRLFDTERSAIVTERLRLRRSRKRRGLPLCIKTAATVRCSLLRRSPDTPDTQSDMPSATTCVPLVVQGRQGNMSPSTHEWFSLTKRFASESSKAVDSKCVMDVSVHSVPSIQSSQIVNKIRLESSDGNSWPRTDTANGGGRTHDFMM